MSFNPQFVFQPSLFTSPACPHASLVLTSYLSMTETVKAEKHSESALAVDYPQNHAHLAFSARLFLSVKKETDQALASLCHKRASDLLATLEAQLGKRDLSLFLQDDLRSLIAETPYLDRGNMAYAHLAILMDALKAETLSFRDLAALEEKLFRPEYRPHDAEVDHFLLVSALANQLDTLFYLLRLRLQGPARNIIWQALETHKLKLAS